MRLTLGRALVISALAHVLLSGVLVAGLLPGTLEGGPGPPLLLDLVEPAEVADPRPDPPAPETGRDGNVPARAALGGGVGGPGDGPPDGRRPRSATAAAPEMPTPARSTPGSPGASSPQPTAAEDNENPEPVAAGARPEVRVADLQRRLQLDAAGLPEVSMGRLHPLLARWARHPQGRTASSYRELLRTYIDVLMGHPYPVVDWLGRHPIRYLAELEVAVGADGSFRFTEIYFYPNLPDDDGRVRDYYRRLLREVAGHPFLPPREAGLPAPHHLSYRLVNPETR